MHYNLDDLLQSKDKVKFESNESEMDDQQISIINNENTLENLVSDPELIGDPFSVGYSKANSKQNTAPQQSINENSRISMDGKESPPITVR